MFFEHGPWPLTDGEAEEVEEEGDSEREEGEEELDANSVQNHQQVTEHK